MIEFLSVNKKDQVLNLLMEFSEIFPHLFEKIDNLDSYAEKISSLANVYIAQQDGKKFGIAVFYTNDAVKKNAYISLIGLKEEARGKGQGRWLLQKCEEVAKNDGMIKVVLEVDCDNISAIRFYEKCGYSVINESERNSFYMSKEIC